MSNSFTITLSSSEVAEAIIEFLERRGIKIEGPRTVFTMGPEDGMCTGAAEVLVEGRGR